MTHTPAGARVEVPGVGCAVRLCSREWAHPVAGELRNQHGRNGWRPACCLLQALLC